jgi:hypothetical protein
MRLRFLSPLVAMPLVIAQCAPACGPTPPPPPPVTTTIVTTTTVAPPPTLPAGWSVDWNAIAHCVTGGNWSRPMQRENPSSFLYGGGLKIPQITWDRLGGRSLAATPAVATKAQQVQIAERIYAEAGRPDGC